MRTARAIIAGLVLAASAGFAPSSSAQTINTLVPFSQTWKYLQVTTNLGTAWRASGYNDAAWLQGPGLLTGGETAAYPEPFRTTTLSAPNDGSGRLTDYFRTTFTFTGSTNGIQLWATNLVDDGCVIYLNGVEAGRLRVPANQDYLTQASGGPATEGIMEPLQISPGLLRPGQINTLAVEVHQSGTASSDLTWGMRLVAYVPTPLSFTLQPTNETATAGDTVVFRSAVSGGPATFQWQKDQVNIPGATSSNYTISPVATTHAGSYRVIVTNSISRITSSPPAVLTVFADTEGPVMQSAIVGDIGSTTNQIEITFDENVAPASATTNNIRVVRSGTAGATASYVTLSTVAAPGTRAVRVRVADENWNSRSNYYILCNNVADTKGNLIAPNAVIPVSFRIRTNVTQMTSYWDYYTGDVTGGAIYTENEWYLPGYQIDPQFWGTTYGILHFDPAASAQVCAGDSLNIEQTLSFQFAPSLYRSSFFLGTNFGTVGPLTATLQLRYMVDDGMILYLNGVEIYRYNVPAGQLTAGTRAITTIATPTCSTNIEVTVTNLMPRTNNYLAAAVVQSGADPRDIYFGLELDGIFTRPGVVPTNGPANQLRFTPTRIAGNPNSIKMTWPNTGQNIYYGYLLEESAALLNPSASTAWFSVSNQSNGIVIPATQPARIYRLRKGPNTGR